MKGCTEEEAVEGVDNNREGTTKFIQKLQIQFSLPLCLEHA
jgi:hypothetical protein